MKIQCSLKNKIEVMLLSHFCHGLFFKRPWCISAPSCCCVPPSDRPALC